MNELFTSLETQYGLPTGLLDAMWEKESNRGKAMLSPKGASGHFQFMPDTASAYGVEDPSDLTQSATGAAKYMSDLLKQFGGNVRLALAGYNAGPGKVSKFGGVPPYKETMNYVNDITSKIEQDDIPSADELDAALARKLTLKLERRKQKSMDRATTSSRDKLEAEPSADYWQNKIEEDMAGWKPIAANIAGGILGGVGGAMVGAATPLPGAAPAYGVVGGAAGSAAASAYFLADHPAPLKDKLDYLAKQGLIDIGTSVVLGGVGKIAGPAIKFLRQSGVLKNDADVAFASKWFADRGAEVKPKTGSMAGSAVAKYKNVAEEMEGTLQTAIANLENGLYGVKAQTSGVTYQTALKAADDTISKWADTAFAPFKAGGSYGGLMVNTSKVQREAVDLLTTLEKQGIATPGSNTSTMMNWLRRAAMGQPVPLNELAEWKRGMYKIAEHGDEVGKSLEGSAKSKLARVVEESIQDALKAHDPAAFNTWRSVNNQFGRAQAIVTDEFVKKAFAQDPVYVSEFIGRNATPDSIKSFKKALGFMAQQGTMTNAEVAGLMHNVQRNWVEKNMSSPAQAAELWRRLSGRGRDAEVSEIFDAVFKNSTNRQDILDMARTAAKFEDFVNSIPRGSGIGGGTYATFGSIGAMFGGSPGAATLMGTIKAITTVPGVMAKAVATNDRGIINRMKYIMNWMSTRAPSTWSAASTGATLGAGQQIPVGIERAASEIQAWLNENGFSE